jgi:predicted esterase
MPTYSQLMYRELPPSRAPEALTVIALHGDRGGLNDLIPFAESLSPAIRIVAPEAARGVYQALEIVSRTWFGGTLDAPEPASFGDSLAQLEKFVYDVRNRAQTPSAQRPLLMGFDQGGVLALTAALVFPDLISGVIAIDGGVPTFRRWSPPELDAAGLPVLLIDDPAETKLLPDTMATSVERLRQRGAAVEQVTVPGARSLGPAVTAAVQAWLARRPEFAAAVAASAVQSV